MTKFIPYNKMSKKAQKELNRKARKDWQMNPVTKVVPDKTKYNRAKFKQLPEE